MIGSDHSSVPLKITQALSRYIIAIYNLGFRASFKIFLYSAVIKNEAEISMETRHFGRIFWNTKKDWVINHFYTPQLEIYSPTKDLKINTIVDLGANIGIEAIRLSYLYENARVIAVEAEKGNFKKLEKNTANHFQIEPVHAALWSENCELKLIVAEDGNNQGWHLEKVKVDEDYDMVGLTFSELIKTYDLYSIDILKIDLEGAEIELFDNEFSSWIHEVKCLVIECPDGDSPLATSLIFKKLEEACYKFNTYLNGENLILIRSDLDWLTRSIEIY